MRNLLFAAAALLLAQPVFAAANPWLGTWKLNQEKSTFTGTTTTITRQGEMYHFDFGAVKFDLAEDGKDYPTVGDTTASLTKVGPNHWQRVIRKAGTETSRSEITLSDDEKSTLMRTTGTRGDGTTFTSETTAIRVGEGSGIVGTWKDTKHTSTATNTAIYSDAGDGRLKVEYPERKTSLVLSFDGKPVVEQGPRAMPGETILYQKSSPTEITYVVMEKNQPYLQGVQTISPDGTAMKNVSWLVSQPTEKEIAVFEKQ